MLYRCWVFVGRFPHHPHRTDVAVVYDSNHMHIRKGCYLWHEHGENLDGMDVAATALKLKLRKTNMGDLYEQGCLWLSSTSTYIRAVRYTQWSSSSEFLLFPLSTTISCITWALLFQKWLCSKMLSPLPTINYQYFCVALISSWNWGIHSETLFWWILL